MHEDRSSTAGISVARQFAEHIQRFGTVDLPPEAVAAAKRGIFDTVGVMIAGASTSVAQSVVRMVARWQGVPESTVLGLPGRIPAPHAAFANGAMAHQFDYDETHDQAFAHPSANSLPAALAVAESRGGVSGMDLIRAVALANDVVCRLGCAIEGGLFEFGWVRPAIVGTFGAAAASASILKLSPREIESAFGLTLHQTAGTLECLDAPGSDVRGLRDGFSTRAGVTAAYMAREGIQGDQTCFEGRFGLFNLFFQGKYRKDALTARLGVHFEGARTSLKPWPSAREMHGVLDAVLRIVQTHDVDYRQVQGLHLKLGQTNLELCEPAGKRRHPTRRMDALGSIPYTLAVALRYRAVPLRAYQDDAFGEASVAALADRITWELDPAIGAGGVAEAGSVSLRLHDGRELSAAAGGVPGHPDHPLGRDLMRAKFADCLSVLQTPPSPEAADALMDLLENLEQSDVAHLSLALGAVFGNATSVMSCGEQKHAG